MYKVNTDKNNLNIVHGKSSCLNAKDNDNLSIYFQSPKFSINSSDDEYFLENTNQSNLLATNSSFEASFAPDIDKIKLFDKSSPKVTPMEVDSEFYDNVEVLSGKNINDMTNTRPFKTVKINNKLVKVPMKDNLIVASEETELKTSKNGSFHFYLSVVFVIVCVTLYYLQESVKSPENVEIEADLRDKVFGQETIVDDILNILYTVDNVKILAFTGSSGVGKTFVANTLKTHFPNVLNFYGRTELPKNVHKLKMTKSNLLIFDDLNQHDTEEVSKFVNNVIKRFSKKDVQIVVVLIFTIQSVDDDLNYKINYEQIPKFVSDFNSYCNYNVNVIQFKEFTQTDVEKWVQNELKLNNISDIHWQKIVGNVLKGHNVLYKGLKGLHARIKLEIAKFNKYN